MTQPRRILSGGAHHKGLKKNQDPSLLVTVT